MNLFRKLQQFILPAGTDFFVSMQHQSAMTEKVVDELYHLYIEDKKIDSLSMLDLIKQEKEIRKNNLQQLYAALITPIDKEAISRAIINLDWVVLSIEHLHVELETYGIRNLEEYESILVLLKQEMENLSYCFSLLEQKKYDVFSNQIFTIVHLDNLVIKEYAKHVSALLSGNDIKKIIEYKEILTQLKEVSKRIRICANNMEDMIFKML